MMIKDDICVLDLDWNTGMYIGAHFQLKQKTTVFNKDSIFDNGRCGEKKVCELLYNVYVCTFICSTTQ